MATIGFIGLGNMGGPMLRNLLSAGHEVAAFDVNHSALEKARKAGATVATSTGEAAAGRDAVITMLPAGQHVRSVYLDKRGVMDSAPAGALLIDCSTIDVETARDVTAEAARRGLDMVDAPVSGGAAAAAAGTLTFMVGGTTAAFSKAQPILAAMGRAIVHAGTSGAGQAAKICNNLILGISMIGVSEAFLLAEKLGLDAGKLFEISSQASGQCWSLTSYCPVPGPVPASPANRNYEPGFAAVMMLKDLRLSQEAAETVGVDTPIGAKATEVYEAFCNGPLGRLDFSGVIKHLRGDKT